MILKKMKTIQLNYLYLTTNVLIQFLLLITIFRGIGDGAPQVPASARRTLFSEPTKQIPGPEKNYTGIRVNPNSKLVIYHHEQTIAVVEVGDRRQLFNCELLEVKTKADKKAALKSLKPVVSNHIKISFNDMKNLMEQCQKLDLPKTVDKRFINENTSRQQNNGADPGGLAAVFSGVVPGTKWCGTGDIAGSYFDLGNEKILDKCCRTHDLCPVKVAGFKTQYNLTNISPYTRSHCDCDDKFYSCLKKVKTTYSDLIGNLYFNVAPGSCVDEAPSPENSKIRIKIFKNIGKRY